MDEDRYRSHRRPGETTRFRLLSMLLVSVLVIGAAIGGYLMWDRLSVADYSGEGTGKVEVTIPENATLTSIGEVLTSAGVVRSPQAFVRAAQDDPRGQSIQSGTFSMRQQMSGAAAVAQLLDAGSRVVNGIVIPEGTTANGIYRILAEATDVPIDDFTAAAEDPEALGVPADWFTRDDGQKVTRSVEGFLYPATYEFAPGATAENMLSDMVKHFLAAQESIDFAARVRDERGISPYEALIVASLAQAEAGNNDDLGKIARVAYNRVYGDFHCNCLEFDVGINYYYQLTGKPTKPSKDMTNKELYDEKNPYRLHGKAGLTPTPINNPGLAALKGAMDPPEGDWLFFVAIDKEGHSAFSETVEQHEKDKATARKNGIL